MWNRPTRALLFGLLAWHCVVPATCEAQSPVTPATCDAGAPKACWAESIQIERGQRRPVIDAVGNVLSIPRKLLIWDRRVNNHDVSDATVGEVATYLEHRGLSGTAIRVNQYAPADEWRRLRNNHQVGAGWRYSVGAIKWLGYTLFPGRLFGNDQYNPYTNTLYLYSDMPTLGLAEAAYAKDVNERQRPGTYAAVQEIQFVSLWHETLATRETLNYVALQGSSEEIAKVRHDLYSRYGLETASVAGSVLPDGGMLFSIAGATAGHLAAANQNRTNSN